MTIDIELIEQAFDNNLENVDIKAVEENLSEVFNSLNSGNIRVAYESGGEWIVNQWIKKAILLSFKLKSNKLTDVGYTKYYDKLVSRFENISENYLKETTYLKINLINSNSFNNFSLKDGNRKLDIILLSAVLQYLNKWQESLKLLINFSPEYICILHAPIAINSNEEARAIQNVKTSEGYCGPAMITLFPRRLIEEFMNKNKYALLSSFPLTKKSKD